MPFFAFNLATSTAQAQNALTHINWSHPSWDLFIVIFFVVAAFLYGLSLGRDRIIVILISIYMALAVVNTAPIIGTLTSVTHTQYFVARVSIFVAVFVVLFFMMAQSALLRTVASSDTRGTWWQVILFSFLQVGLLISITLSFLPPAAATHLAPLTQKIFVQDFGRFMWIVAPIVAMILIKGGAADKRKQREKEDGV